MNKVLDELGLQIADQVGGLPIGQGSIAPGAAKKTPTAQPAGGSDLDADLEQRLENLRRE